MLKNLRFWIALKIRELSKRSYTSTPRRKMPERWRTPKTKYARRRTKCRLEGRCPHCGKPCAPFYECPERRAYKKKLTYRNYIKKKVNQS